jgi:hypothetical protein
MLAPVGSDVSEGVVRPDLSSPALAEQPVAVVPETVDALIEQMSVAAGVIFAGQVIAVRRPAGIAGSEQDAAEGIVEIDLRVDQSARGPAAGSIYTLREWTGLWAGAEAGGSRRYRVGQRLLLFLYPPDAHGLTAPVHGAEGAIPLRGSGVAPGPDDTTNASAEWLVDLRWLQAQAIRSPSHSPDPVRPPINPISPIRDPILGPASEGVPALPADSGSIFYLDCVHGGQRCTKQSDPSVGRAVRQPWGLPPAVETQPLSQVLALCHQALTLQSGTLQSSTVDKNIDAMRGRDATR